MWFLFLVSTLPKNFPSTLPAIYGEPSLISLCLWHSIKSPGYESMCLPIGLGLWGSYSDIARGLIFGHCFLLLLFSSPSWVLSKEQSSGFPNLMRFYSALSALLFIEVSRRRAHNWCSPEQMFFREGCCLQTVPKISVTSREIRGQMLVFYRLNAVTSTFIKVTPCLLVSFQSGWGRKTQAEFGISKLQPFGGNGLDF